MLQAVIWPMGLLSALAFGWADPAPEELLKAAREHRQHGRYAEALEQCDQLRDGPVKAGKLSAVSVAIEASRSSIEQGLWDQGEKLLEAALKIEPKSAPGWAELAQVQYSRGNLPAAQKTVDRALQIAPEQPRARLVRSHLFASTGRLAEADEGYRSFVRLYNKQQPKDAETLLIVAEGAAEYARWNGIAQIFDFAVNTLAPDILQADPLCWEAHALTGELFLEKYNEGDALPELKKALAINPRAAAVLALLAVASLDDLELNAAEKSARQALEVDPGHRLGNLVLARIKLHENDPAAAEKIVAPVLKAFPHDESVLAVQGVIHLTRDGVPPEAELTALLNGFDQIEMAKLPAKTSRFTQLAVQVAKQNPRAGAFLTAMGKTLMSQRRFTLAERFFQRAIALMPQRSDAKAELGLLYMHMGKTAEAKKMLAAAFSADPYHVRVSNMRKVVELLESYELIQTDHFQIRVDSKADRILGQYLAEYLEAEYPKLVQAYGYEPRGKTQFEIYNRAKGRSGHEWFSTRMVGVPWIQTIGASTGMIVALASPTGRDDGYNWARVLRHEYVHILTLQKTDFNIPHWFTEALAVASEGYPRPLSWDELLVERFDAKDLFNLDTLNNGFQRPRNMGDWTQAYSQSQLYHEYIVQKFGADKPRQMLDAFRETRDITQIIKHVLGVPKAEFESGYTAFVKQLVERVRSEVSEKPAELSELEKQHEADPDDAVKSGRYAWRLLRSGKQATKQKARELAEAALKKQPDEVWSALTLADLELQAADLPAAEKLLRSVFDPAKPQPLVVSALGKLYRSQDDPEKIQEVYAAGVKRFPRQLEWQRRLAVAALRNGDRPAAIAALEQVVRYDPDDQPSRFKRAELAFEDKDYATATRYARMALEVDVLDVPTHRLLARSLSEQKQTEQAIKEWKIALAISPKDSEIASALAEAEIQAGKNDAARKDLEEFLRQSPDDKAAKKLLESLPAATEQKPSSK